MSNKCTKREFWLAVVAAAIVELVKVAVFSCCRASLFDRRTSPTACATTVSASARLGDEPQPRGGARQMAIGAITGEPLDDSIEGRLRAH
jgi:hypothetical protein